LRHVKIRLRTAGMPPTDARDVEQPCHDNGEVPLLAAPSGPGEGVVTIIDSLVMLPPAAPAWDPAGNLAGQLLAIDI
jgi:hypothetical protein